jgi:hypothetical protein
MEGRVFICRWKREGDRYRVWWKARPKVFAEGDSFEQADEALYERIMGATGDGENMREYDPPPPGSESDLLLPLDYVSVSGRCYARIANQDELFADGLCPECLNARGARTDVPLQLSTMQDGPKNGGTAMIPRPWMSGPRINFVSEEFLELLTVAERERFTWREMKSPPRVRKRLFELVDADARVPRVLPVGLPQGEHARGWWCEACGYQSQPFHWNAATPKMPSTFVSVADLPGGDPSIFAVGRLPELKLCFAQSRWREILGEKGAKGMTSSAVGVVAEARADRSRPLRTWRDSVAEAAAIDAGGLLGAEDQQRGR